MNDVTVEQVELLGCPFCDGPAKLTTRRNTGSVADWCGEFQSWVYCNGEHDEDCAGQLGLSDTREQAIAAWNTRAAATTARNDALEEAAQAAYKWWDGEPEDAEDLREYIQSLKSQPAPEAAQGWQDISTAPKDGTEIVAHDQKTGTSHVTYWDRYEWYDPDSHYYSEAPAFVPTLWTRLLVPPVDAIEAGEHMEGR